MYGLVNKAIEDMVLRQFGEEAWERIKTRAELDVAVFVSMQSYPDDLTHRLVRAASEELGISPAAIMSAFGEFWVQYTAKEGYGPMFEMAGETFPEFLQNLDALHARVGMSFPALRPPSFECTEVEATTLNLHYRSSREGLTPMVEGLVKGLGSHFQTEVTITQTANREEGADHDVFTLDFH
jgi:hypothetical protein